MAFLFALWLPIVVASVVLFFASAMAWMLLKHHGSDFQKLEKEDAFLESVRSLEIAPGRYGFPEFVSHDKAKDPEVMAKFEKGPFGVLTVFGPVDMRRNMILTFVYFLVTSSLLGYLLWTALESTAPSFMKVFRVASTAGVLMYSCSSIPNDIWFRRPVWTNLIDGIAFGLIAGGIFAALWPYA